MSIGILVGKIAALFIVMFLGFVLVKTGICRSDDSRILSRLSVYIVVPCSILSAFQVSCSPSILNGLLLAVAAAVLIHLILIVLFYFIGPLLHLNGVEKASIIYSNAGNPCYTTCFLYSRTRLGYLFQRLRLCTAFSSLESWKNDDL